jgi:hypothetical protein
VGDFPHSSNIVTVQEVGGEEEKRVFDSNEEEANVTHLLPGTLYIFSVVAISVFGDLQATSLSSNTFNSTTTITVPAPVCSEIPQVRGTRLVVNWTYKHTGGEPITSVDVSYTSRADPTTHTFSDDPQAVLGEVGARERGDSIPLPEAGRTYKFSVTATNGQGPSRADCPPLALEIGIPAIPDRPLIDSAAGNIIIIRARTSHSGVSDINEDAFQFVFQVVTFCCSIIMAFA